MTVRAGCRSFPGWRSRYPSGPRNGSPAKVVDQLKRLEEEIPLDYLLASILSHQTFLLLTDEVIPRM